MSSSLDYFLDAFISPIFFFIRLAVSTPWLVFWICFLAIGFFAFLTLLARILDEAGILE